MTITIVVTYPTTTPTPPTIVITYPTITPTATTTVVTYPTITTTTTTTVPNNAGYSGDGQRAIEAFLASPSGVAMDMFGNLYIADSINNAVRQIAKQRKYVMQLTR